MRDTKQEIIAKLVGYKLGLKRKTVNLVPYETKWKKAYGFIRELIFDQVPSIELHHIGSTALLCGYAKPILDILVIFEDASAFQPYISELVNLGFTHKGPYGVHGREFFTFYGGDNSSVDFIHLHAFPKGHPQITHNLNFRDKLLKSPELTHAYSEMKLGLKAQNITRKEYPEAKTCWILAAIAGSKLPLSADLKI